MNNKYPCDVIKDLLPGYIDGILSEAGTKAVKEHLEECEACRQACCDMGEELDSEAVEKEQLVLDGFKKVRKRTRNLKLVTGIAMGAFLLLLLSVFMKVYVIGTPLSTHQISANELSYNEETDCLNIGGRIQAASCRVSRVVWKPGEEDGNVVHVLVYAAETLPWLQGKKDFTVSIPDMKGKRAYLACPDYDRMEVYNWKNSHYEKLAELEDEIYNHFSELDRTKDALSYMGGAEVVNGIEGARYSVDSVIGEGASFWWFGDQLVTDGDLEAREFEIWISFDKPYQILVYDYQTGEYTEDGFMIKKK